MKLLALAILALPACAAPTYVYHSRPGAAHKFLVDFYGQYTDAFRVLTPRPAYDRPDLIPQVMTLVAKAFAPFDVDVTTERAPDDFMQVLVGGGNPTGSSSTGTADQGFYSYMVQPDGGHPYATGWVYTNQLLPGDPVRVAQAICHEAGHIPGNYHQADVVNGVIVGEYRPGVLMGNPYGYAFEEPHLWSTGINSQGLYQDDAAVIGGVLGYAVPACEPGAALLACGMVWVGCQRRRRNLGKLGTIRVRRRLVVDFQGDEQDAIALVRLDACQQRRECFVAQLFPLAPVCRWDSSEVVGEPYEVSSSTHAESIAFNGFQAIPTLRSSRQSHQRPSASATGTTRSTRANNHRLRRTASSALRALTYTTSPSCSTPQPEPTPSPSILKRGIPQAYQQAGR